MKIDNYRGSINYKPTPAQKRVLARFKASNRLPAHPDYWQQNDMLPLQALLRRGFLRFYIGAYGNYYIRTHKEILST